jgi:hypothetical protein
MRTGKELILGERRGVSSSDNKRVGGLGGYFP